MRRALVLAMAVALATPVAAAESKCFPRPEFAAELSRLGFKIGFVGVIATFLDVHLADAGLVLAVRPRDNAWLAIVDQDGEACVVGGGGGYTFDTLGVPS